MRVLRYPQNAADLLNLGPPPYFFHGLPVGYRVFVFDHKNTEKVAAR